MDNQEQNSNGFNAFNQGQNNNQNNNAFNGFNQAQNNNQNNMNMNGMNFNMNGMNNGMNFNMNGMNNGMNMNMNQMFQMMNVLQAMQQQLQQQQQQQQPQPNPQLEKKKKEMRKNQAIQMGKILKEQKELMEKIKRNEMIRQHQRMSRKITLFFKFIRTEYDFDLLPIEFKATTKLKDVFEQYKNDSNNQNVRFMLDEEELEPNDERLLGEMKEINDGEEIRVVSIS